ncbi:MAG: hypothetical protein O7G85_17710, partial [Planctomycetota bacterium]|nr:hypothetical protein [Planctomycetota bacterium]
GTTPGTAPGTSHETASPNPPTSASSSLPANPTTNPSTLQPHSRPNYERPPRGPKRVRDGMKLKALKENAPNTVLSIAWLELFRVSIDEEEFTQGFEYAKSGQVITLDIQPGAMVAKVQGVIGRPYSVRIGSPVLDEAQWQDLIQELSSEAIHTARLLSAKASDELHDVFESIDVDLIPLEASSLTFACDCRRPNPCRHVATVAHIIADRLESRPALIFTLRGLPFDELLDRLRHARQIQTRGVAMAHADPMIPETQLAAPPLEECLDDFWRAGRELEDVVQTSEKHVEHALLRRLGPSPLEGKFPIAGLLASIYDTVSRYAIELRDRAEGIDEARAFASEPGEDENGDDDASA